MEKTLLFSLSIFIILALFFNQKIQAQESKNEYSVVNSYQLGIHAYDIQNGKGALNMEVQLFKSYFQDNEEKWLLIAQEKANSHGVISNFLPRKKGESNNGMYKLVFLTQKYFDILKQETFYPYIDVVFKISEDLQTYWVPIKFSAFGYSTYRGN